MIDLEAQIERVADEAFSQTSPVAPPAMARTMGDAGSAGSVSRLGARRRPLLLVAAGLLVVLLGGLAAIAIPDDNDSVSLPAPTDTPLDENDSTAPDPDVSLPPAPAPVPDFSERFSVQGMLAEIPFVAFDNESLRLSGADFSAIADASDVERTEILGSDQAPNEWTSLLFRSEPGGVFVPYSSLLSQALGEPEGFQSELGFSLDDVDRFVSSSNFLGEGSNDVLVFPFDVISLRGEPPILSEDAGDDGIVDIGEGADGERNTESRTDLRPIGRPLRVAVDADRATLMVTASTPTASRWLALDDDDGDGGEEEDGGSDIPPDLAAVARALDRDDNLYAAEITAYDRSIDGLDPDSATQFGDTDVTIVEPFSTLGIGWSGIGETERVSIVYVFADDRAAAASVGPIDSLYRSDNDLDIADNRGLDGVSDIGDLFEADTVQADGRTVRVTGASALDRSPGDMHRLLTEFSTPLNVHR